jgi:hypothetical protein
MFELNKNFNLLEEQLAESGLEMSIEPVTATLIGAGLSAGSSILGGIFGSSQADKANKDAKKAQKKQEKAAKKAADNANKYNARAFEIEKANYFNNRRFQREIDLDSWRYQQEIQDIQYQQVVKQYAKSVENTENQLVFNSLAAIDAYKAEQSALNDIFTESAFERQGSLVDRLQQEGTAALGQAGNSRNKALQSVIAGVGRNSAINDASLVSSVEQSQRNMRQIALQKYGADLAARAEMMIRPEAIPDIPQPKQAPERIFIEPMEVTPTYIPPAVQQSTVAPIVSGVTGAVGAFSDINWANVFKTD